MSKVDTAWEKVCRHIDIVGTVENDGVCLVNSDELRRYGEYEARLMCKFDTRSQLPSLFRENNLAIVPGRRGTYTIGHFDLFQDVEYPDDAEVDTVHIGRKFDSLPLNGFTCESSAITASHIYGILDRIADDELTFTRFGRTGAGEFEYDIAGHHILGDKAQIEMDGCFEGDNAIVSIEAKIKAHTNFCIRQLFYPLRYLMQLSDKTIHNVFMTGVGSSVYTHEYVFDNTNDYNSIRLERVVRHDFFDPMPEQTVEDIINDTPAEEEDFDIIFPQSDSIAKVISTINLVAESGMITDSGIADGMGVADRQGGYYANATLYLGFTRRIKGGRFFYNSLSQLGGVFINADTDTKHKLIIRQMCKHGIFRDWLQYALDGGELDKRAITADLTRFRPELGDGTPARRAGTVKSWVAWAMSIIDRR